MWAYRYLGPNDSHGPWHGDGRTCTQKCQNGKIVHTHLGIAPCERALRFAHVVCESWGPMCISYIAYVVRCYMFLACRGGLNIVRVGPQI